MVTTINLSQQQDTNATDTVTIDNIGGYSSDYDYITKLTTAVDTSNTSGSIYTMGGGSGLAHSNVIWTTGTNGTNGTNGLYVDDITTAVNRSSKISVKGKDADIDINGKSLVRWMEAMEERMNWMQPNVELEKEWDDLKKLGDRYRKLEQKCREKSEVWKQLKSLPKVTVDT